MAARLGLQLVQHLVDRPDWPEVDAALERGVDLDVEPGFDAARQKLHRHRVDDSARQRRASDREAHQQPQREPGAEHARPVACAPA